MNKLSVVLISKNQEWNIGRLIESILLETSSLEASEIVLVDSASSDNTVDVASHYPIKILRLRPEHHLTPAAGRYMGIKHTNSELILCLDGDMELYPGWLANAIDIFKTVSDVASITGELINLPKKTESNKKPHNAEVNPFTMVEIPYSGGAAIFRRSVLEQVGSFNPYLYSDEEPDLCIRIRHAGYRIIQLNYPIVYHYSDPDNKLTTQINRWRRDLFLGAGQNIRYHLGKDTFWTYFRERGYGLIPILGMLAGVISLLIFLLKEQFIWFAAWLVLMTLIITVDTIRKRCLYRAIFSLLLRLLIADGTVRGFLLKPLNPDSYPEEFDRIK
ncbi:MAG: glycosyltransferase [Candidatus Scalindua sp. AMX11]|nr:MAG: glycosyltransferase [Candidatus Scalindua sp.]NOG83493.1 glycosyltransferase [Planctomycetota bacterium]RZV72892.1 MAG: glycosyltransferase [Candidatus Scalindua sp. SCAELEC01]TDE64810.1 MAG: glycosyltransferase [Candidatus Scalindua sp. AMX11]GJQ59808.1 MAG: glycosyl transferase [Candidatus Scalindua sp.]